VTDLIKTYREYPIDAGDAVLIVNTDYADACRLSIVTDRDVHTAHLLPGQALDVGTKLIAWSGSASSWAEESIALVGTSPSPVLELEVQDGEATIGIGTRVESEQVTLPEAEDWTNDLGRRLIAFGWAAA
jgi:hypothetical protein